MRDDDDGPALVSQIPQPHRDSSVQAGIEPGGRLVEEQQGRFGQQFPRDVGPLELPARQLGEARARVPGQAKLAEDLIDTAVPLAGAGVGGEADLSGILQGLAGGQPGVQGAFLRDQADAAPQLGVLPVQVPVVIEHDAGVRRAQSGQRAEQGRLARAARSDDAQQAALGNQQAHVVKQHLAAPDRHHEVLRGQADLPVVDELPQLIFCQAERGAADPDNVILGDHGPGYWQAVDKGAILAAEISDLIASRGQPRQLGVMGRGVEVIGDDQVVVGSAADPHGPGRQRHPRSGAAVHGRRHPRVRGTRVRARRRCLVAERGGGGGGHGAAVVVREPFQGSPGGQRHALVPAAQDPGQLLDRPGPDSGQPALHRLLEVGRQRRGCGDRAAAAGDVQLPLHAEGPLAGRLVRGGRPHLVVDVVIKLVQPDQAVLVPVGLPGLQPLHQCAGEHRRCRLGRIGCLEGVLHRA